MSDHVPQIPYATELKRKAIHLGALVLPASILVLPRPLVLGALTALAVLAVALDVAQQKVPAVRRVLIDRAFGWMMRPEELGTGGRIVFNGAVWMFLAAAACAWLFPPGVAAASLAMLMVGDGAAAVVGRRFGRTRWPGSPKSVEGSAAYALTAFAVGAAIAAWPPAELGLVACAVGAVVGAAVEALPIPVNDNVRVPLVVGLAMVAVGA
ncbi:SEC59/DGK1/VTE5 family protein [Rubrivirga sp. S365]|uniref:SEC59/DGK1/VTE5 family protein n=1 Tax=Rubrivirga litoralis TaxID=3075598 RepID=A0ABU3BUY5_9BACT|nr:MULTISPECIES: SEC59/DGK1/VTE5 family protein [unclassified Rubrivirga]MDT0633106.1 SEC59/DGK1/VTE5 family protein [Rubrivirga sp. F394]MDT7857751.1 SEC59/DGK1/VTE5 family protein [Rubrivirga sp. S365]